MTSQLSYSFITDTGREVRVRWTGKRFELTVFGANWSDVQIEWTGSLNYAIIRFNNLVKLNSKRMS
jgi:hypothetical protein